jgi:hypothetical protein
MVSVNVFWIEGGNFLIFEKFLELSKANLHLKTTVWISTWYFAVNVLTRSPVGVQYQKRLDFQNPEVDT